MAGSKSNYLENALLDHVFGGGDFTRPASVYFTLYTVAPTDAGGGTECAGGNYARKVVTNNGTNFPAAGSGVKTNGTDIQFLVQTAAIGTVVAWGVFDALTSGNLLYWGDLSVGDQKAYLINDQPVIPAGSLTITED
jgi:hypothetical protein